VYAPPEPPQVHLQDLEAAPSGSPPPE